MLKFLLAVFMISGFAAQGETQIACWGTYSKRGSKPILKATIEDNTKLKNVSLDLKNAIFEGYFIDKNEDAGERWGHKRAITKSELVQPEGTLVPEEITTNRSPYKGNNEYDFILGTYSFTSPYHNISGEYDARLILPKDLSAEHLKAFRFKSTPKVRSNAVMIYPSEYDSSQYGSNYLRLFCASR